MSKLWVLGLAFLLLLAAFPLISFGTTGDNDTLWWIGLTLLVVGGLVPPVARYAFPDEEDEEGEEAEREDGTEERPRDRRADTEPAEIRVTRTDDAAEPDQRGAATRPLGEHERLARAHEQRAEAHRERAHAHEELAKAEEERARAEADEPERRRTDPDQEDGADTNPRKEEG